MPVKLRTASFVVACSPRNKILGKILGMAKARLRVRAFEVAIIIRPRSDRRVQSKLEEF
jgi:hypothetical protein